MKTRLVPLVTAVLVTGLISGCATTRKKDNLETQGLKNQVISLQQEAQARDQEIANLRQALASRMQQDQAAPQPAAAMVAKDHPTVKQIQMALKKADHYSGAIDGQMGHNTRAAIRSFQKANGLKPDGKVGKDTWALLKRYLNQKVK